MSRLDEFFGSNNVDALFGDSPITSTPFPRAGRLKHRKDYDKARVTAVLKDPNYPLTEIDPRTLSATQESIIRDGVEHYMKSDKLYADEHNAGNTHPVVYRREGGENLILSGTHRATSALLKGQQFRARVVDGPWGEER